ncbi:hypothetical protein JI735_05975 [Paenibacillus sonchi]|uniref:Peptidase C51 domain-containing protein n=1 Tax=Paenibacillus sonchi TaxID=373687 RepID=A0A974PF84_9BACL|nr:hypothetical protein JI735_05975 [Paenibacillus sonchi]
MNKKLSFTASPDVGGQFFYDIESLSGDYGGTAVVGNPGVEKGNLKSSEINISEE